MTTQLSNEQILIIGFPAWDGDYMKSTVLLAKELAKENEVLYVEYPFTWKDMWMGRLGKSKAPWKRMMGKEERLRRLELENGAHISVLTLPPMLPINFLDSESLYDALMLQNAKKAFKYIKGALDGLGMEQPVVINAFNPFLGVFLARQFEEKALFYYCYDEISAAKWAGKHGPRLEQHLMQEADAVIVSSQHLLDTKKPFANQIYMVKNGVDFDLFSQTNSTVPTSDKKVVGYLGSLDDRLDYGLLETCISNHPHYLFRFVGRINSPDVSRLQGYGNVEILGPQPPSSLPGWVQSFDVCMIPFAKNEFTAGIYPLKINEYFAAGKPVVTTHFSDLSDFHHLAEIAKHTEGFSYLLEKAIVQDDPMKARKRKAFARRNSWSHRATEMGMAVGLVVNGIEEEKETGKWSWMPNNYNRWGDVSHTFFQPIPKNNSDARKKATSPSLPSIESLKNRVFVQNMELLVPEKG